MRFSIRQHTGNTSAESEPGSIRIFIKIFNEYESGVTREWKRRKIS
jgi:hypothetical protein